MKAYLFPFIICLTISFWMPLLKAQYDGTLRPGWSTLSIDAGWSYLQSDVPVGRGGYGLGLQYAKNIYSPSSRGLEADIRLNAQYNRSFGLDYKRNFDIEMNDALNGSKGPDYRTYPSEFGVARGFVYNNHRTTMGSIGMDFSITPALLRRKHRINIAMYGGIGLNFIQTMTNQLNGQKEYFAEYANLDLNKPKRSIQKDLRNGILDPTYETLAEGYDYDYPVGIHFMPRLGIELGFDITPYWGVGLGHQISFSGIDHLDGFTGQNNQNDLHHYTYAQMYFRFYCRETKMEPPVIQIIQPFENPLITEEEYCDFRVNIKNVSKSSNIKVYQNGKPISFSWKKPDLQSFLLLEEGVNIIRVEAENRAGKKWAETNIVLKEPQGLEKVYIQFTNPDSSGILVTQPRMEVKALAQHVSDKRNLLITHNGRVVSSFQFNPNNAQVSFIVTLKEGENQISIEGKNRISKTKESIALTYKKPVPPPAIQIKNPRENPYQTSDENLEIVATVSHVRSRDQINLTWNGRRLSTTQYQFNIQNGQLTLKVKPNLGQNILTLIATNESGSDQKECMIYRVLPPAPKVLIRQLENISGSDPHSTCRYHMLAEVQNISLKNQVKVYVNGKSRSDFEFKPTRGIVELGFQSDEGPVEVQIAVQTPGGSDKDQRSAFCKIARPSLPVITIYEPQTRTIVTTPNTQVKASIKGISHSHQIRFSLNGISANTFHFNPDNGQFFTEIPLVPGENKIDIAATNIAGRGEATTTVIYRAPQIPIIQWVRPHRSPADTVFSADYTMEASVLHIENPHEVKLLFNGRRQLPLDWDSKTHLIKQRVRLSPGLNTFKIEAKNQFGQAQSSISIYFHAKTPKPQITVISISQPTVSPFDPNRARSTFIAKVSGIDQKDQVAMELNGTSIPDFDFDPSSGEIRKVLDLVRGINTIVVHATNRFGNDKIERTIQF